MRRRLAPFGLALALALAIAFAPPAAAKVAKCPDATYTIDLAPLFAAVGERFETVTIAGKQVSVASGCEPVRARIIRGRKSTKIRAKWKLCGSITRVKLRATLDDGCSVLSGAFDSKSLGEQAFLGVGEETTSPALADGLERRDQDIDSCTQPPEVLDAIEELCDAFGLDHCGSIDAECWKSKRQLFTGTKLIDSGSPSWNGRGGSGDPMADAVLCTLRDLSPQLGGPLASHAAAQVGPLGLVTVDQEVGFNHFDRLARRFDGYRRIVVSMPIVGTVQAITQPFTVRKRVLGGGGAQAGLYPIAYGYGLDVEIEEIARVINFTPPSFKIGTPLGVIDVQPKFTYGANASVIYSPYDGNFQRDVEGLFSPPDHLRLNDRYGIWPGIAETATPLPAPTNLETHRGGWTSGVGLGTRGAVLGQEPWTPEPTGPILRPDDNVLFPRSTDEALPSVYAKASAEITWPDDPAEVLPSWVFGLPFLNRPIVELRVVPSIEAGVSGQLHLAVDERVDHEIGQGELGVVHRRLSTMSLHSRAQAAGGLGIETGVHILVDADFPFPIGHKTFIDIDETIPIPIDPDADFGEFHDAFAASQSPTHPTFPGELYGLTTFHGATYPDAPSVEAFIDECYAPQSLDEQPTPKTDPVPGNPADLFSFALFPCNICVHTRDNEIESIKQVYEAELPNHPDWDPWPEDIPPDWKAVLLPATTEPSWLCNSAPKTGCYDLCRIEPPAVFVVDREPAEIIGLLPPTPEYDDERVQLAKCHP